MKKITSSISKISNKSLALLGAAMLLSAVGCTSANQARCADAVACAENNEDVTVDLDDCVADADAADEFRTTADAGCDPVYTASDAFADCADANSACDADTGVITLDDGACESELEAFTEALTTAAADGLECFDT